MRGATSVTVSTRWLSSMGAVLLCVLLAAVSARANGSPGWTATGSMNEARHDHTATLLADGKVLIQGAAPFFESAELYDPASGTFTRTGTPSAQHGLQATATRLRDGRVLLVGGETTVAELYDPATGTFGATGPTHVPRNSHTATRLRDGKVLIAGGGSVGGLTTVVELYDPATGSFSLTGSLHVGRAGPAAALLPDGRVLIAGGFSPSECLDSAEIYDPASGTFSLTGTMNGTHCGLLWTGATLLGNGKVLVAGGGIPPSAELFDPATGSFTVTGAMTTSRSAASATLFGGGRVLFAGGSASGDNPTTAAAEWYDPGAGTFAATAGMIHARQQHTATLLPNCRVLVTGGAQVNGPPDDSSAELFSPLLDNANIRIAPNGVQRVGGSRLLTARVNVCDALGFHVAPDGTQIDFAIDSGPGAFTSASSCIVSGGTGGCQVTLGSSVTGVTTVSAHTTLAVGGASLTRATNGLAANSDPAMSVWVDARISLAASGSHRIGDTKTLTAMLEKDTGTGSFVPAAGETVTISRVASAGATPSPAGALTCTTNTAGTCGVTFTSTTPGKITGSASSTLSVAGSAAFTVGTDGLAGNSGEVTTTWVDARISIAASTTNVAGNSKTLVASLEKHTGTGTFAPAAGETVTFTLTASNGATPSPAGPLACTTNAVGQCELTFTSATAGQVTGDASSTLSVGGSNLFTVATDGLGGNSGAAATTWVDARMSIVTSSSSPIAHSHTLTATLEKDTGTGSFVPAGGEALTITLVALGGATASPAGPFMCVTNTSGQCDVTFVVEAPGKVVGHARSMLSVAGSVAFTVETDGVAPNSGDAGAIFLDERPAPPAPPADEGPRPGIPSFAPPSGARTPPPGH